MNILHHEILLSLIYDHWLKRYVQDHKLEEQMRFNDKFTQKQVNSIIFMSYLCVVSSVRHVV